MELQRVIRDPGGDRRCAVSGGAGRLSAHQLRDQGSAAGGGDFYNNQNARIGELFATQVLRAAMEGRIGFKEAYDLTGLHGGAFQKYAGRLGVNLP